MKKKGVLKFWGVGKQKPVIMDDKDIEEMFGPGSDVKWPKEMDMNKHYVVINGEVVEK